MKRKAKKQAHKHPARKERVLSEAELKKISAGFAAVARLPGAGGRFETGRPLGGDWTLPPRW